MNLPVVTLLLVSASFSSVMTAQILAVFPMPAKSHHILFNAVLRTLVGAGHEVVSYSALSTDKEVANLTVKHLANIKPVDKTMSREVLDKIINQSPIRSTELLWRKSYMFMMGGLTSDKHFLDLINSNEKFDLIILEAFFGQEILFALGHKFKAPVINLHPFGAFSLVNRAHGNSLNLAHIPDFAFPYSDCMTLYQRTLNTYSILSTLFNYYLFYIPEQDEYMRRIFNDPSLPHLTDMIVNNLALTLSNAHPYVHYSQPYTPNIQPIGGIHLAKERTPLPTEMRQFLDGAPEGVVYFSVGSIVPDHLLGDEYFNNFISVFRSLPQRVLWKTNRDLKNLPSNVITAKWVPQQDVLAHPQVRVFMTHGGLFSQHEVIQAGVPVVCTPYFGDQPLNAKFYEEKGIGVILPFQSLSKDTILSALTTVLGDPKYKDNMARMSRIYRDRPISPADTLLFWVDYVVRHRGAPHLRPASSTMPLYQLYLVDIIAIPLGFLFSIVFLFYRAIKNCLRKKHRSEKSKSKKEN